MESTLTLLPRPTLLFWEWIFPNSLKFPCSGLLGGWIFRANNNSVLTESINLPLWVVYSRTSGTSIKSFQLKEGSLSLTGLSKIADGVYQYSLQSPLQVEEGDIVGVRYQNLPESSTNPLLLSFIDGGSGADGPESYTRPFMGSLFVIADDNGMLPVFVTTDMRYTPLVTAVMSKCWCGVCVCDNIKY